MTKLNELAPRPGSTKNRMRVGRGPGSGKGKTAGRGVKGQKARSGVAINGFEGGQMPLHMRMPKRGFNKPNAKEYAEVNLWRIEQAIEAGKLDRQEADRRRGADRRRACFAAPRTASSCWASGELKSKLDITVYHATASARAAVEKAGGSLTTSRKAPAEPRPKAASARPAARLPVTRLARR